MLIDFFLHLKERRLPVSTTEFLTLLEALSAGMAHCSLDDFHTLARLCLVKNEAHYDRFDLAFGEYFRHVDAGKAFEAENMLEDWMHAAATNVLSEEDLLMLDIPFQEQPREESRSAKSDDEDEDDLASPLKGGGGNNPLGEGGVHQEGIRLDNLHAGNRSAIKAWDSREFQGLDDEIELNTRSIKMALRRLRKFAREGAHDELDLEGTIASTARNAGWLDIKMRPERRNKVKVLILFDTGGSMVTHVKQCEELFSAVRSEFKQLEYFYFHNCVGDSVWRYNGPHLLSHYPVPYLLNKYGKDYKLIVVGDASMSPVELLESGGGDFNQNVNLDSGANWMRYLLSHYKQAVWLNPEPERFWHLTETIGLLRDIMEQRMYPLTLAGLDQAMKTLGK
ncbi:MAG: hypothetical protein VB032_04545 [Burkholderiaceae bacterium]|nr:hypothetical protein [Burkholderiaceae bacterium]